MKREVNTSDLKLESESENLFSSSHTTFMRAPPSGAGINTTS